LKLLNSKQCLSVITAIYNKLVYNYIRCISIVFW